MACGFVLEQSRNQQPDKRSNPREQGTRSFCQRGNLLWEPELGMRFTRCWETFFR